MATVNIYLNYNGNCKEAFEFYRSVFGGEFDSINTFSEIPPDAGMPVSDKDKDKIMHVRLPISKETTLMGSDTMEGFGPAHQQGNNFSVSVQTEDTDEATRIFNQLSEGGKVTMPMSKTFWGALFGMFTDKFGIPWMVNCDLETGKK